MTDDDLDFKVCIWPPNPELARSIAVSLSERSNMDELKLTSKEVQGVPFDIYVDETGKFRAEFAGELYEADTFVGLTRHLRTAVVAARYEVPFVDFHGYRGVIRGYHAGLRDILVTWENGKKESISTHHRASQLDETEQSKLRSLLDEIERLQERVDEITADFVSVEDLLNEAAKVNLTDKHRSELPKLEDVSA
jgi:hypothetical protein